MTTIERAKKFFKRIHWWSGEPNIYRPEWPPDAFDVWMYYCQSRVARALIRQQQRVAAVMSTKNLESEYDMGLYDGLNTALLILDAVYGRKE